MAVIEITNLVATLCRDLPFNKNGELKKLGELLYMPKLAKTLERIRDEPDGFYNGELAKDIMGGGIFTLEDLKNYKVKFRSPMNGTLANYSWYSTAPPGSGVVLSFIFNILKGTYFVKSCFRSSLIFS